MAACCLPACLGGGKNEVAEGLDAIGPTTSKTNRLNMLPQELYQVDEFPMEMDEAERWVVIRKPKPKAKYRMIMLPWTGGNSSLFAGYEMADVEVAAIELPGRQARAQEPPYRFLHPLVAKLAEALEVLGYLRQGGKKLLIFGHSFGSLIGYELACVLRRVYKYTPHHFIVAAGIAPKEKERWATDIANFDDDRAVGTILEFKLAPVAVATSPDFKVVYIPILRADYNCMDTYTEQQETPLSIPILVIVGSQDNLCHGGVGEVWKDYTKGPFTLRTVKGNHYFTHGNKTDTMTVIEEVVFKGKTESDPIVIPDPTKTGRIHDLPA